MSWRMEAKYIAGQPKEVDWHGVHLELCACAANPCTSHLRAQKDVLIVARLCWPVFAADWSLWTRSAEPSDESISKVRTRDGPAGSFDFAEEDVRFRVPAVGAVARTSRWS